MTDKNNALWFSAPGLSILPGNTADPVDLTSSDLVDDFFTQTDVESNEPKELNFDMLVPQGTTTNVVRTEAPTQVFYVKPTEVWLTIFLIDFSSTWVT